MQNYPAGVTSADFIDRRSVEELEDPTFIEWADRVGSVTAERMMADIMGDLSLGIAWAIEEYHDAIMERHYSAADLEASLLASLMGEWCDALEKRGFRAFAGDVQKRRKEIEAMRESQTRSA